MLETISYTLAAIILYVVSDMLLQRLELNAGHRFEHRSVIFFFILSLLAVSSFSIFKYILVNQ
jgi:hypothetical protein